MTLLQPAVSGVERVLRRIPDLSQEELLQLWRHAVEQHAATQTGPYKADAQRVVTAGAGGMGCPRRPSRLHALARWGAARRAAGPDGLSCRARQARSGAAAPGPAGRDLSQHHPARFSGSPIWRNGAAPATPQRSAQDGAIPGQLRQRSPAARRSGHARRHRRLDRGPEILRLSFHYGEFDWPRVPALED